MKNVTANVYTEDRFSVPPNLLGSNPSFVTTTDGIVMIDTPMHPPISMEWRKIIAAKGEVKYIINTHHHIDHVTGNFYFPGTVIAHEGTRRMFSPNTAVEDIVATERVEEVRQIGEGMSGYMKLLIGEREPGAVSLMKDYVPRPPAMTFTEDLTLRMGNHTFQCLFMPGHTPWHIGVYIPEEKVFFAGDNFTRNTQPSLAHCDPVNWVKTLKRIETMDIDFVVPGHGEVCGRRQIAEFREFIEQCIGLVRDAIKKGLSAEQAAGTISFENMAPGAGKVIAVHPGSAMQRRNVLRIYEALSKKG